MAAPIAEMASARARLLELGDAAKADCKAMLRYLRLLRELGVKDSANVVEYGSELIRSFRSKLPEEEYWQLHEDVGLAAAETGCVALAKQCATAVMTQFPNSVRAKRLRGIALEASGDLEAAKLMYDGLLEDNPTNPAILKRKVALALTSGDLHGAIEQLVAYVDLYQTDRQAWEQLCDLYTQARLLEQARFCAEEVLVHGADVQSMLRLADLLYALSGAANLKAALGYYCKVIELSKGESPRALVAALATVCELGATKGYRQDHSEVAALAAQQLLATYERDAPAHVSHVRALLQAQNLHV